MANVPKNIAERLSKQLGTFQRVLASAKDRDVNESDTVTIITDMLADLFGFDKYTEVTSEQAIRGTYCDLAVKLEGVIKYLIEVKAIGLTLKENHLRQAVNYGANQGIPWVVLTNGIQWEIYRIKFERPIDQEHTCSIDILDLNARKAEDLERLYLLCREGLAKDAIEEFHAHAQNVNRFVIAALIQSDPVLNVLRRELRRLAPDAKVTIEEIQALLPDVLKRDVMECESAKQAERRVRKSSQKTLRKRRKKRAENEDSDEGNGGDEDTAKEVRDYAKKEKAE
jgi:predicted type IV restriction endonuclease